MKNRTESLNAINELSYEIDKQELEGKSGSGWFTAIQLTAAGKCGAYFTGSFECTSNNVSCG
ncbi:MAG TPA: lantibiotic salivaricin M precursor [Epulopiscium sp.]|nr:lantibiotic salivaricin M precursor [Candidatus Epulonipiscium sp.]